MTLVTTTDTSNVPNSAVEQQQQENGPILGKFATQDDLIAAYQALEAKQGQQTPPAQQEQQQQTTPAFGQQQTPSEDQAAQTALAAAGIDFNALSTEFATTGELGAESIDKLLKAGFTQDTIDNYVEGAKARAEQVETRLYQPHGGFDKVQEALAWAGANMAEADVTALNKQFEAKDEATIKMGVDAVMARYKAANPPAPNLAFGGQPQAGAVQPYASQREMTKIVGDPRYGVDQAFTDTHNRRLMATDFSKLR